MQLQQKNQNLSKIAHTAIFLYTWVLLVKKITAIYKMAGKFWSLKIQPMSHLQVRGMSLNPKLIEVVQFVPVLHAKNCQFRIWPLVEKQLRHNRSGVW